MDRDQSETRTFRVLGTLIQDLRYAIRTLYRTPAFAATAVAALALGIGANTAVFSVINAVLLKPLTYPDPDRIVEFLETTTTGPNYGGSATKFNVWREQTGVFQDVSAYEYGTPALNLTSGAESEQVQTFRVSAGYFRLFGAPVAQGRTFTADEDRPNGGRFAVLNYGLWQRRFGADPGMVGKTISLNGAPYEVIGILGPGFQTGLDSPPDVLLPLQIDPSSTDNAHYFIVVGRLKPGVTPAMAKAQLQLEADEFRARFPSLMGPQDGFGIQPLQDAIVSDVRPALLVLAGAVCLVLLIACANVANLLLVRATARKREIALRAAIGAGRGRIIRQLLTESVLLSVIGGGLGLVTGLAGVRALLALNPGDIPRIGTAGSAVTLDWHVLAFTVLVALVTGVLFGLAPAIGVSRADLGTVLKEGGGRSGTGAGQNSMRSLLVISEMALALVLLVGAALLIRTFFALRAVDPGFKADGVLTIRMSLAGSRFDKTSTVSQLARDGVQRIESLPGVEVAAAGYGLPLEGAFGVPFNVVGRAGASDAYDGRGWMGVSPQYFDVFKIPVLSGRVFNDRDDAGSGGVAIINQTMARRFWPDSDPLGERIILGKGYGPEFQEPARQIIGVVGDVHDQGLNRNPGPLVYVPLAQVTDGITALAMRGTSMAWIVRTPVPPQSMGPAIEKELEQVTEGLPVARVRSMAEVVSDSTRRDDFNMTLLVIFGGSALVLAIIGIYGLMAYSVGQRTQEMGIRMALGAASGSVRNMVISEGMRLALIGVGIGVVAALGLSRLIASFLFGVTAWDPLVFTAVPILLSTAALFAVWLPARRAARTNPVDAMKHQ
jgi:putative ABC transport system permease protein